MLCATVLAGVLLGANEEKIDLNQTQAIAGAILGIVKLGESKSGIYAEAAKALSKPAKRLSTLGSYSGDGKFIFNDPDSAEKAMNYVKGVEVTSSVNRCFSALKDEMVIYRAPINEAYQPLTEVKVKPEVFIFVDEPDAYNWFETLAKDYNVDWGVNRKKVRSGGKPLPEKLVSNCKTVMAFWDAYSKIPVTQDTTMVNVYKKDLRTQAEVGFSKGAELFKGFLLADSVFQIYNIYAVQSPFKKKIDETMSDLSRRADPLYKYLTQGDYLFQEAHKELVTNPDGSQSIKQTQEKRGTRWQFVQWFLPELVDITKQTLRVFGKELK